MNRTLYIARSAMALLGCGALLLTGCGKDAVRVDLASSVTVTPALPSIVVGSSLGLSAVVKTASGSVISAASVDWSSSDTSVATVNTNGIVTAKKIGISTIVATSGGVSGNTDISVIAAPPPGPAFNHVFVVGMLQTDYSTIFPASGASPMPFIDSLAKANGRATQYYGNSQPSIANFYMLAVGDTVTRNDNDTTTYMGDNVVRQLLVNGRTWKSYAEDLPYVGYTGPDNGLYSRHHNVFSLIGDVKLSATQRQNLVPLTRLSADIAAGTLPNYGFIVPNECHNTHMFQAAGCTLSEVDSWLRGTLTPLLNSPQFQQDGLLIILWDRSRTSATRGGGQTAWIVVSSKAKAGYTSSTVFQHQSTLRLTLNALGIGTPDGQGSATTPGLASIAPDMMEFFNVP